MWRKKQDGRCSYWFNGWWLNCCKLHDGLCWLCETYEDRKDADICLRICVQKSEPAFIKKLPFCLSWVRYFFKPLSWIIGWIMFFGVRTYANLMEVYYEFFEK